MTDHRNDVVIVSLKNAIRTPQGCFKSLDFDPDIQLAEKLLDRIHSFGFRNIILSLFLSPVSWQGHSADTVLPIFQHLAKKYDARTTVTSYDSMRSVGEETGHISQWLNILPEEKDIRYLAITTNAVFLSKETLSKLLSSLSEKTPFALTSTSWCSAVAKTRYAFEQQLNGQSPQFQVVSVPEIAQALPSSVGSGFGIRFEYIELFSKFLQKPAPEWSASDLSAHWKSSPELFRGIPRHVGVEITNDDNLPKRLRSPRRISNRDITYFQPEQWDALLNDLPLDVTPISLDLWDFGEPLLNKHAMEFIEAAVNKNIRVDLYTNGILLNTKIADRLLNSGLDALFVRLDAANADTYGRINGNREAFELVTQNVNDFLKMRRELSCHMEEPYTKLAVQITEMPETTGDFDDFFKSYDTRNTIIDNWKKEKGRAPNENEIRQEINRSNMPVDYAMLRHDNLFRGKISRAGGMDVTPLKRFPCRQLHDGLYILSSGDIVPCREDVDGEHILGSIDDGIMSAWKSERCRDFHRLHDHEDWTNSNFCSACQEWYYTFS